MNRLTPELTLVGGKIAHQKLFDYDHILGCVREKRHESKMLEALMWVFGND